MLYYIVFIRSTINMLSSYNPYIGIITIKQVNRSGGVITAATMPISTSAGGAVKKKASNILNHSTPFLQAHHVYSSLLS